MRTKSVVMIEFLAGNGEVFERRYLGTPSNLLASKLAEARTFTDKGHAKNAIPYLAHDCEWRRKHGTLAHVARFRYYVQPVKLSLAHAGNREEVEIEA